MSWYILAAKRGEYCYGWRDVHPDECPMRPAVIKIHAGLCDQEGELDLCAECANRLSRELAAAVVG